MYIYIYIYIKLCRGEMKTLSLDTKSFMPIQIAKN